MNDAIGEEQLRKRVRNTTPCLPLKCSTPKAASKTVDIELEYKKARSSSAVLSPLILMKIALLIVSGAIFMFMAQRFMTSSSLEVEEIGGKLKIYKRK